MPTNSKISQAQSPLLDDAKNVERSFGILHRPGMRPVSVEEMDEAIGRFLAEDDERIQKRWREKS